MFQRLRSFLKERSDMEAYRFWTKIKLNIKPN